MMDRGEPLQILGSSAISSWSVQNRPQRILIEYLAQAADGRWVLVTRPESSPVSFDHVRAFFGPMEAVEERKLTSFARQRDGGTTSVRFLVDGVENEAYFPMYCSVDGSSELQLRGDCPGELIQGTDKMKLIKSDRAGGLPAGASFICGT